MFHLDLCSGIGGFALAAQWAGYRTIAFCEIEKYAIRLLQHHWPGVRIHEDIRTLNGYDYQDIQLCTAGFPCQPFSQAGKQRGTRDDRYLWPEVKRIVQEAQPSWFLGENVVGITNLALDTVHSDLEDSGYEVETVIIPAAGVSAPHRRERCWIIARCVADTISQPVRYEGSGQVTGKTSSSKGKLRERQRIWADLGKCGTDVADTNYCRSGEEQRWRTDDRAESVFINNETQCRLGVPYDGLPRWVAGHPNSEYRWEGNWEEDIPRVVANQADRNQKLKALGNAICPQVAYEIIYRMKLIDDTDNL